MSTELQAKLHIFNTLSRRKEPFRPLVPGKVGMYVCGMTIYDLNHMGHGRMLMAFDVVQRWLRAIGFDVTYVRNITDIDDKIIKRSVENGETIGQLTERFIAYMHEDLAALGIQAPDVEPRATRYVPQMLAIISQLEAKGLAYHAPEGDVNFAVRRFPGYGKLSGKSLDELRAGERVAPTAGKDDPLDFVLWKSAKPDEPAQAKWDSAWGQGRPGWHIECSAMSCATLGETFDIHGGGEDLQFPHHENEIAQSEGAFGKPMARYWMHNGFLNVDNTKMSKSLNNFFTIRDVLKDFAPEVIRFFMLRTHYRSQFNYADTLVSEAKAALTRLYIALKGITPDSAPLDWSEPFAARFAEAMCDDFNTPVALAVMYEMSTELNKNKSPVLARQLTGLGAVLGVLGSDPSLFLKGEASGEDAEIDALVLARTAAKKAKNFPESDRIRNELHARGITLEDAAAGTTWRRA